MPIFDMRRVLFYSGGSVGKLSQGLPPLGAGGRTGGGLTIKGYFDK